MTQQPVVPIVDGVEEQEKTTFLDFPNEVLVDILKYADQRSGLKMRLNMRLDALQLNVKYYWKEIRLNFPTNLLLRPTETQAKCKSPLFNDGDNLNFVLNRLSKTTYVEAINITAHPTNKPLDEQQIRLFDELFSFHGDFLQVQRESSDCKLPKITLQHLLNFTDNLTEVRLDFCCSSIAAKDFSSLRKTMLRDDCKLQSFYASVELGSEIHIVKECFGVEIEDSLPPRRTRIYRANDENIEIYSASHDYVNIVHYECGLETSCLALAIIELTFEKGVENSNYYEKVQLNHLYELD
ncbi:hypothetical protein PRIPAC_83094 [Pristionchus pacificus]|uniref:Uncharacterized protein n=1 Tax=Pristionchus pacificus TaxID=54126 RepID=A0A2A6BU56_PRIPA|nr:hypothetical protein PRIPAC_83094 [Pristionchus pacificus]|eukprot:PDM69449.1 hypothetical protein PRIPAC_44545 [Pristionchus pacificus]